MTQATNEMVLSMISAPVMGVGGTTTSTEQGTAMQDDVEMSDSMVIGAPASMHDPKSITVYANSINPVSYSGDVDGVAAFDVVFSVGMNCADGTCKTYQVVKRIGIDKIKIAHEAESSTPVSIVEARVEAKKAAALAEAKRFRVLAGLE